MGALFLVPGAYVVISNKDGIFFMSRCWCGFCGGGGWLGWLGGRLGGWLDGG